MYILWGENTRNHTEPHKNFKSHSYLCTLLNMELWKRYIHFSVTKIRFRRSILPAYTNTTHNPLCGHLMMHRVNWLSEMVFPYSLDQIQKYTIACSQKFGNQLFQRWRRIQITPSSNVILSNKKLLALIRENQVKEIFACNRKFFSKEGKKAL